MGAAIPLAASDFVEADPSFSPDGRWLAYSSNESGQLAVYVRPFPEPGGKFLVSVEGGANPEWSRSRSELFYMTPDRQLMVVAYRLKGDEFIPDKPRLWNATRLLPRFAGGGSYSLHPDGKRIVAARQSDVDSGRAQESVVFVFNFLDELRRLTSPTPTRR
jgi:hypothetical protein